MKIAHYKIDIVVGKVRTVPGIAAFLGQKGIALNEFVTVMDKQLFDYKEGTVIPVIVIVIGVVGSKDFKYMFKTKTPKTTALCAQLMNEKRKISYKWVYLLAKQKQKNKNMQQLPLWFLCKMLLGTIQTMAGVAEI